MGSNARLDLHRHKQRTALCPVRNCGRTALATDVWRSPAIFSMAELRGRAELKLNLDTPVFIFSRPLKEALETRAYGIYTDSLHARRCEPAPGNTLDCTLSGHALGRPIWVCSTPLAICLLWRMPPKCFARMRVSCRTDFYRHFLLVFDENIL